MTARRSSLADVDCWPWPRLLTPAGLTIALQRPDSVKDEAPALAAMIGVLEESNDLGRRWCTLIGFDSDGWSQDDPVSECVVETRSVLLDAGFRTELTDSLVVCFLAVFFRRHLGSAVPLRRPLATLGFDVALAVMGGLTGEVNADLVDCLVEHAATCGCQDALKLSVTLREAKEGNPQACSAIVELVLPYWRLVADNSLLEEWGKQTDMFGFPFEYAQDADGEADALVLRATLLYEHGRSGQEDLAVRLAVEAALKGSAQAWNLLNDWAGGDGERVLNQLLSVGSHRLSGVDCRSASGQ